MLQLVVILKTLNETALFFLLGQGMLAVLAGRRRDQNVVYNLFRVVTRPALAFTRRLAPRFVPDRHIGVLALLFLLVLEGILIVLKVYLVTQHRALA